MERVVRQAGREREAGGEQRVLVRILPASPFKRPRVRTRETHTGKEAHLGNEHCFDIGEWRDLERPEHFLVVGRVNSRHGHARELIDQAANLPPVCVYELLAPE